MEACGRVETEGGVAAEGRVAVAEEGEREGGEGGGEGGEGMGEVGEPEGACGVEDCLED